MRRLPPLNALRCFEAAARLGSFNAAAGELCVTPSAISHQIKTLEAFLGSALFRREKRRTLLTGAGRKYLSSITHALDEIDTATRRLISSPNSSAVNISVVPGFLTRWLVPRLRDFQEHYPDVELRLSASTASVDFQRSDIDMAIYFGRGEWEGVEIHYLRSVSLRPVCSPHLLRGPHPLRSPADLQHHTLLHVANRAREWDQVLEMEGLSSAIARKSLTLSSTALALSAAIEGAGVALSDRRMIERELEYGQLVIPFDIRFETKNAFYLVYQQGRPLTYGMQCFSDWLRDEIGQPENTSETQEPGP
ncbi:MAG: transcriptional regulator [Candidatus Sedimenticola endophacoides]|uniref:Transcriptional regulator n=1 Tax=Candidatus Sedimenticola endophacoides TaxID=2548426 RepID=A0A657PPC7_9GAMM|nr:MAG: transcriptional regulator [Candidatus Sedimenticola endophacoides]OQX34836.1 MAG: transcriptional regulator [Candidatus Sedimenticola endophacoides]OQX40635.1 MAG: transcriptional regulator [Candidatus Sedimenticola endophacoides]OQX41906.1 MAG: transcriptional regulator [Candidatus Sedimenticola endophacoides]OQX48900.1 MAG: transcriptional regulator [Candidatus Sedimenticola endophacoides]